MALYPRPLDAILADIATKNGVTLVESEYTFGNPVAWVDPTGATNTQLVITADPTTSPYSGPVTVDYSRLDLAELTTLLPLPIACNGIATIADFLALLNAQYGLNFDPTADLVPGAITTIVGDGSGTVTLTAQANSLGWIGTVTLSVIAGRYPLDTLVTTTTLPGLLFPAVDETKPYGPAYSYWRDFSAANTDLAAMTTSTTDFTTLAADLATITANPWSATASGRYSLLGGSITYNGPVAGYTGPNGETGNATDFDSLLIFTLGSGSLGFSGALYIHYDAIAGD